MSVSVASPYRVDKGLVAERAVAARRWMRATRSRHHTVITKALA